MTPERTLDGTFVILINGFQWGGTYDRSGAGNATFSTPRAAREAYTDAMRRGDDFGTDLHTCGACGSMHLKDRSCDCFDNGCQ